MSFYSYDNYDNIRRAKAKEQEFKKQWLNICPSLNDKSGIYVMTREEDGFKYAYVGQAKHILTRLAQHLAGYDQHIDKSLKKHKLYSKDNICGWKVQFKNFPENELDEKERFYMLSYANMGYQLRNKTSGGQDNEKFGINENKESKGYFDGIKQGKKKLSQDLLYIIDKHLIISLKKDTKISQNALEKFYRILNENI